MNILDLPPELLSEICLRTDEASLPRLMVTNRAFYEVCLPYAKWRKQLNEFLMYENINRAIQFLTTPNDNPNFSYFVKWAIRTYFRLLTTDTVIHDLARKQHEILIKIFMIYELPLENLRPFDENYVNDIKEILYREADIISDGFNYYYYPNSPSLTEDTRESLVYALVLASLEENMVVDLEEGRFDSYFKSYNLERNLRLRLGSLRRALIDNLDVLWDDVLRPLTVNVVDEFYD